jgi:hypothetical protein
MPAPWTLESPPTAEESHLLRAVCPDWEPVPGLWELVLLERPDLATIPVLETTQARTASGLVLLSSFDQRRFACECAERVLHLYEEIFPDDDRPWRAVRRARQFSRGETSAELLARAASAAGSCVGYYGSNLAISDAVARAAEASCHPAIERSAANAAYQSALALREAARVAARASLGPRTTAQDRDAISGSAAARAFQEEESRQLARLLAYLRGEASEEDPSAAAI